MLTLVELNSYGLNHTYLTIISLQQLMKGFLIGQKFSMVYHKAQY